VLCAVLYDPATREEWAWVPGDPLPVLDVAVAHNATGFDRFAAEACGWRVGSWLDSSHMARRAGLPASLDALAKRWLGRDKDKDGNRLTLSLSRPSRAKARKGQLPDVTPEVLDRVIEYCANDVEVMAHGWDRLRPWSDVDADTCAVDTVINDRGVCLDVDLVRCLQRHYSRAQEQAVGAAAKALGWTYEETRAAAMSPQQLTDATGLPNAQKDTLKAAARKPDASIWDCRIARKERRWPMPTGTARGKSIRTSFTLCCSAANSRPVRGINFGFATSWCRWTRPPSGCAWRCSIGRISREPRGR
jgi:hypothetical protein